MIFFSTMYTLFVVPVGFILSLFAEPVNSFDGEISISPNSEAGKTAVITCRVRSNDTVASLLIKPTRGTSKTYFRVNLFGNAQINNGLLYHDRMSASVTNDSELTVEMTISDLKCSDKGTFTCLFLYGPGGLENTSYTAFLNITGCPRPPTLATQPDVSKRIPVNTHIFYTCTANVGRTGRGTLMWNLLYVVEQKRLRADDPRIVNKTTVPTSGSSTSSTENMTMTILLTANKYDNSLVVVCFVDTSDFLRDYDVLYCNDSVAQLCVQSKPLQIYTPYLNKASRVPIVVAALAIALTMVLVMSYLCFRFCVAGQDAKPKKTKGPDTELATRSSTHTEVSVGQSTAVQSTAAGTEVTGTSKVSSPMPDKKPGRRSSAHSETSVKQSPPVASTSRVTWAE